MTPLDFARCDCAQVVSLDGDVVIPEGWACPLLALIHERHNYVDGIRESLRNACRLIDTGLVKVVGVESVDKDPEEIPEDVMADACRFAAARGFDTLAAYRAARTDDEILADATVVEAGVEKIHFATALQCLRPDALIISVDDSEAFAVLQGEQWDRDATRGQRAKELARQEGILPKEAEAKVWESDKEYIRTRPEQYVRDRSFWEKLLGRWEQVGFGGVAILNAGTQHQARIPALVGDRASVIHLRPTGL